MSKFYDFFWTSQKYPKNTDFKYKHPIISKFFPRGKKLKILDYGCGEGIILKMMHQINPASSYVGVDISKKIIQKNKKRMPQFNFFQIEEEEKLPFQNSYFDFIISTDVIEHVYNTPMLFKELSRILKPGGKILLTVPYHGFIKNLAIILSNKFELIFDPESTHIRFFTKKSLSQSLKNTGLTPVLYKYFGRFYPLSRGMLVIAKK